MEAPDKRELFDYFYSLKDLESSEYATDDSVYRHSDVLNSYGRWAVNVTTIFHRPSDDTYWALDWQKIFNDNYGEFDQWEEAPEVYQVWPQVIQKVIFTNKQNEV